MERSRITNILKLGRISLAREKFRRIERSAMISILIGSGIIFIILFFTIFADFTSPYDPLKKSGDSLEPPSKKHLFGTDRLGRDIFSRMLYGARTSISVSLIAVAISSSLGVSLGILCGFIGGKLDRILTIPIDALYAFPGFLLALVIAIVLGTGIVNTGVAVAFAWVPVYYRVVRSITLSIKESLLIEVETTLGASNVYIILHHVLPRCTGSIVVLMTLGLCRAMLSVCGLGFLGFGVPPPTPEWGTDLSLGRLVLVSGSWWPIFFPGLSIFLLVLAFNLLGEGLNTMLTPRFRVR